MNQSLFFTRAPGLPIPRFLLIASTGGHLAQLVRFAETFGVSQDSVWVTFRSPQSESLLAGKSVMYVDYVAPRDFRGMLRAYKAIRDEIAPVDFDGVVSTGAALAVSGFLWARKHSIPATYIESVSRTDGPSATGRITRGLRLANTYTQHGSWASSSWVQVPSVMQSFRKVAKSALPSELPLRILVTLGTIRPYRFDSLVDQLLRIVGPDDNVIWQLGETSRSDLSGQVYDLLDSESFLKEAKQADVVITHSGVGTILHLLDQGISPVVVPRRASRNEHVDDHQLQIWNLLKKADIGVPCEVEDLQRIHLLEAASTRTSALESTADGPASFSADSHGKQNPQSPTA